MKLAPLARALAARPGVEHVIVHTGQHYDVAMSADFFRDLDIPAPDHNLEVGSGSHAQQTAAIMQRIEPVLEQLRPDVVLVYGDVNSTVAAALVAAKLGIRVGHVEAGLRSRDWAMPEEINRVVTDTLADFLFTPSRDADANLLAEGVPRDRIHFVGNVMIDTLVYTLPAARRCGARQRFGVHGHRYAVTTLHRPSNVDEPARLADLVAALERIGRELPVLFPVHPRTRRAMEVAGIRITDPRALRLIDPVGYLEMLGLVAEASLVVTDSGGLQEETTYLGVPCLTVRANTERPVTVTHGTNRLVDPPTGEGLYTAAADAFRTTASPQCRIERWDGGNARRIVDVLLDNEEYR